MTLQFLITPIQKCLVGLFSVFMLLSMSISADAAEFGIFKEFSIYTADKNGFKDKVLLLFHGLNSAHPNNGFRRIEKAFSDHYSVVGFNYDYFDINANRRELDDLWHRYLKGHDVTVLGTSLGGFWANYFANEYGIGKMVLVNPVTRPLSDLTQFIGSQYSERRQKHFDVTARDIERYGTVPDKVNSATHSLVLLTADDPVIDYRNAFSKFVNNPNSKVIIVGKGGHSPSLSDPLYASILRVFLETSYEWKK